MNDSYNYPTTDVSLDKGLVWGLREESTRRFTDIARINAELDGMQKLFYGSAWAWDAITTEPGTFFSTNVEPSSGDYLVDTQHMRDALSVLDINLKRNSILLQGVLNLLDGSEGAALPPYSTDELETNVWDSAGAPSLLNLGSIDETLDG